MRQSLAKSQNEMSVHKKMFYQSCVNIDLHKFITLKIQEDKVQLWLCWKIENGNLNWSYPFSLYARQKSCITRAGSLINDETMFLA